MPPDIPESDSPLEIWYRARLWMGLGLFLMMGIGGALYAAGIRHPAWFSLLLAFSFLVVTLVVAAIAYKLTGKKRPR